jgi:hypothetical protein
MLRPDFAEMAEECTNFVIFVKLKRISILRVCHTRHVMFVAEYSDIESDTTHARFGSLQLYDTASCSRLSKLSRILKKIRKNLSPRS